MGKVLIEVSVISARGLRRCSPLCKLQWFAVGWIDPDNKYCTKIDASGNSNPIWKTKFSTCIDNSESYFQHLALHIEVYCRDPIFLRERLWGTATVMLKEFLARNSKVGNEEIGSFQLWKRNSSKPQGFVDISIRISEGTEGPSSHPGVHGNEEGFRLMDYSNGIALTTEYGRPQLLSHPENNPQTMPLPRNHSNISPGDG